MDEPDESAAYETFQNVVRDLVQPLVGDIKETLSSTLAGQLAAPKGQLAEQGETLEGVAAVLREQATRAEETAASLGRIQTANAEIGAILRGMDVVIAGIREEMSTANTNLARQVQELQTQQRADAALQESDSRLTFRGLFLAASLGVMSVGLLVWMILYT